MAVEKGERTFLQFCTHGVLSASPSSEFYYNMRWSRALFFDIAAKQLQNRTDLNPKKRGEGGVRGER